MQIFIWKDKLLIYFLPGLKEAWQLILANNTSQRITERNSQRCNIVGRPAAFSNFLAWPTYFHATLLTSSKILSVVLYILRQLRQTTCTLSSLRKTDLSSKSFYFTLPLFWYLIKSWLFNLTKIKGLQLLFLLDYTVPKQYYLCFGSSGIPNVLVVIQTLRWLRLNWSSDKTVSVRSLMFSLWEVPLTTWHSHLMSVKFGRANCSC